MNVILTQLVLNFWFSSEAEPLWFMKDPQFDESIRKQFGSIYEEALKKYQGGDFTDIKTGKEALALVILFDQFSRNMFRDTPKAFAADELALKISKLAVAKGLDRELIDNAQHNFLYMPFMHSENLSDQEEGIRVFSSIAGNDMTISYARQHRDIIARFGRFPHRNKVLGRISTAEEEDFLKEFAGF